MASKEAKEKVLSLMTGTISITTQHIEKLSLYQVSKYKSQTISQATANAKME